MTKLVEVINYLRKRPIPVASKLVIAISALMIVMGALFSLAFYSYEKKIMLDGLVEHANFASDLVTRGINYGMLTAQRDVIQQNVEKLGSSSDISDIVIFGRDGRVFAASDPRKLGSKIEADRLVEDAIMGKGTEPRFLSGGPGDRVYRKLTPILNESSCSSAKCHFHSEDERVLGVMRMDLTASSLIASSRKMLYGTFMFGSLYAAIVSVALFVILYNLVTKPIAIMEEGMNRLARGNFEQPIDIHTRDEMELLANTFNSMAGKIKDYRMMLEDWTEKLQDEVEKKTREIKEAHEHLVDAEKLASLGRMAAGVAHELNSPLTGILSFAELMRKRMPEDRKEDIEDLDVIIEQTHRCAKIIKGLLGFARKGMPERVSVSINELIESSASMVRNQSKFHNINLTMDLGDGLPDVVVDPNQLQQVFLNMLTNAADAMDNKGDITISTKALNGAEGKAVNNDDSDGFVEVVFSDTGPGISPEHQGRIFEPFFTTKPVGMGTGLGLPVSYGIVKSHGGDISVKSEVGEGATFTIKLPAMSGTGLDGEKEAEGKGGV